jgi:hypothetical protein
MLAESYIADRDGKDPFIAGRVAFWVQHMAAKKLVDFTTRDIRELLDAYAQGRVPHPRSPDDRTTRKPVPRAPSTVNRL